MMYSLIVTALSRARHRAVYAARRTSIRRPELTDTRSSPDAYAESVYQLGHHSEQGALLSRAVKDEMTCRNVITGRTFSTAEWSPSHHGLQHNRKSQDEKESFVASVDSHDAYGGRSQHNEDNRQSGEDKWRVHVEIPLLDAKNLDCSQNVTPNLDGCSGSCAAASNVVAMEGLNGVATLRTDRGSGDGDFARFSPTRPAARPHLRIAMVFGPRLASTDSSGEILEHLRF